MLRELPYSSTERLDGVNGLAYAMQAIAKEQQRITASRTSVRLVKPDQMHVTLVFLGDHAFVDDPLQRFDDSRVPHLMKTKHDNQQDRKDRNRKGN